MAGDFSNGGFGEITSGDYTKFMTLQSRALDRMYPIVILALYGSRSATPLSGHCFAMPCRIVDSRMVKNKAVYVALGVSRDGVREVLGLWIADNEGAKFWLSVMKELKNRGLKDILIAVVDGLKGLPDAITAAFPDTDLSPKFPPVLRGVLGVRSLALRRHLVHCLSLQKFHRCQVP